MQDEFVNKFNLRKVYRVDYQKDAREELLRQHRYQ